MLVIKKSPDTSGAQGAPHSHEYRTVPLTELVESATNPRKNFDEESLSELAESIRSKGVLSPLVVRPVNGHFEIVAGARRFRAAGRAGLVEVPVRVSELTDAEAAEVQTIENLLRADLHPFEEANAFRAILDREGTDYTMEKLAARIGKSGAFVARRLKLLDLIELVANAFLSRHIGIEHALLIARLAPEMQEEALARCFDGYFTADNSERNLVPVRRLQEWIERKVYLSLESVPFSKDDETLSPEAGSCTNCPKRTGFNTLLFGEAADACVDRGCFHRKLDAHVAQRIKEMPDLVMISDQYSITGETPVLPSRQYVEVIARKAKKGKDTRPEQRLCSHLKPAIHVDGFHKGHLVKVCAEPDCSVHFRERQEEEKRQLRWKAEQAAARKKTKQALSFRHRLLAEVLKRVKPLFGCAEQRLIARFVLQALPHDLACRLAKRHSVQNPNDAHDWHLAEKAHELCRKAQPSQLAPLIFEAILLGSAGVPAQSKDDDLLAEAAALYRIDVKAVRASRAKDVKSTRRAEADKHAKKPKRHPQSNH